MTRLDPTTRTGELVALEDLETEDADDVDPVELHRQLCEMDRIVDVDYVVESGYFTGVTVKLRHAEPDLLAEVMLDHNMAYMESWINTADNEGKEWDEWTHQVQFRTIGHVLGMSMTAKETQEELPSIGEVYQ